MPDSPQSVSSTKTLDLLTPVEGDERESQTQPETGRGQHSAMQDQSRGGSADAGAARPSVERGERRGLERGRVGRTGRSAEDRPESVQGQVDELLGQLGAWTKPILIDLCCGAGGAAKGYQQCGFYVIGVDKEPQPRYAGNLFIQADVLRDVSFDADGFCSINRGPLHAPLVFRPAAVHASPPCQAHSDLQKQNKREYPDLIWPVRRMLRTSGLPYVIENVEGAPLIDPIVLCGTMFPGMRVIRHRLFEASFPLTAPAHGKHPLVFTHDKRKAHHGKLDQDVSFVQVTGGGNCTVANKRAAMGIDWMTGRELNEAIPPAYTEHVGGYLLAEIAARQEAAA